MDQIRELTPLSVRIAIVAALVMFVVGLAASGVLPVGKISDGIHLSLLSSSVVAGMAAIWVFDTFGHRAPISVITGIPDFSGRWEGWYFTGPGANKEWEPMAYEIHQRGARVFPSALLKYGRSTKSFAATILVNRNHKECQLIVSYGDRNGRGTYFLRRVTDGDGIFLKGQEARDGGPVPGEVVLRRTPKSSAGDLRYDPDDWAIPRSQLSNLR
jgi:hypothetical protein